MPRSVVTRKRAELIGLRELTAKISAVLRETGGDTGEKARARVQALALDVAAAIRTQARNNATSQGWPVKAIESIWLHSDKSRPKQSAALVGISKKQTMREWKAGPKPKSPRAKVAPGGRVAESLATMFEFGTTRMKARPAFRKAYYQAMYKALEQLRAGFLQILEDLTR